MRMPLIARVDLAIRGTAVELTFRRGGRNSHLAPTALILFGRGKSVDDTCWDIREMLGIRRIDRASHAEFALYLLQPGLRSLCEFLHLGQHLMSTSDEGSHLGQLRPPLALGQALQLQPAIRGRPGLRESPTPLLAFIC